MSRFLTWLIYRGREPGLWGERIWLIMIGCAVVIACVTLALLLTGVWSLPALPFRIVGDVGWGDDGASAAAQGSGPTAAGDVGPSGAPSPDPSSPRASDPLAGGVVTWTAGEGGPSFDYPAAYGKPKSVTARQDGVVQDVWRLARGDLVLFFAKIEREPGTEIATDAALWREMAEIVTRPERVARRGGDATSPPRYFYIDTGEQAGLGVEVRATMQGRPVVARTVALTCENGGLWLTAIAPRAQAAAMRADMDLVCTSYIFNGETGEAPSVLTYAPERPGVTFARPWEWGYASVMLDGELDGTVTSGDALRSSWPRALRPVGVIHTARQKEPPVLGDDAIRAATPGYTAQAERLLRRGIDGGFHWEVGEIERNESQGWVKLAAAFSVDGGERDWRGMVMWVFARDRRVTIAFACPRAAYAWEHSLFDAALDGLRVASTSASVD